MSDAGPLAGLTVLDMAQYLAGPSAALRLADLGAHVVKVERPGTGDGSRTLTLRGQRLDGDSLLFHTINRGKDSVVADLTDSRDVEQLRTLIASADVLIHSFRPGALERRGLGWEEVSRLNPRLVYGEVSGYGEESPWSALPGQDLLVQARSGLTWLTGTDDEPPTPFGVSVVDQYTGALLVQGVLACLVRRGITGYGGRVQVSLLEAAMDLQFEAFTAYLNGAGLPQRSGLSPAHPYNEAPYGIYRTADGWLALAMGPLSTLAQALDLGELTVGLVGADWGVVRDTVKTRLSNRLCEATTGTWLERLESTGFWCAEVRDWPSLIDSGALDAMKLIVDVGEDGRTLRTVGCAVRIDGKRLTAPGVGPRLGAQLGDRTA